MKLIVGLGNPGREYVDTRHNIGFMLLDYVFGENNFSLNKKMNAMEYITNVSSEKVVVIKPITYMNLSGDAVLKYVNYYKISVSDIIVVQDDLDLMCGKYKLMYNHNSGGHNGIKDIISKIGDKCFLRVKIGIGKSNDIDTKDYVLGSFNKSEKEILKDVFFQLRNIFNDCIDMKFDSLMQKYNSKIHKE